MMTYSLAGAEQLIKNLQGLKKSMTADRLEEAAHAGAEIVRDAAAGNAPRDSGGLADSIVAATLSGEKKPDGVEVGVGPDKKHFYGIFTEIGTRYHAATPWLRPALDENKEQVMHTIAGSLKEVMFQATTKVTDVSQTTPRGGQRKV